MRATGADQGLVFARVSSSLAYQLSATARLANDAEVTRDRIRTRYNVLKDENLQEQPIAKTLENPGKT